MSRDVSGRATNKYISTRRRAAFLFIDISNRKPFLENNQRNIPEIFVTIQRKNHVLFYYYFAYFYSIRSKVALYRGHHGIHIVGFNLDGTLKSG